MLHIAALMRRKRRNMMYADGITLLHLGIVEHSVRRASGCSFAILQSPRRLWSFEQSGPMTLRMRGCVDVSVLHRMRLVRALSCG